LEVRRVANRSARGLRLRQARADPATPNDEKAAGANPAAVNVKSLRSEIEEPFNGAFDLVDS
jgi:hypothetical protein